MRHSAQALVALWIALLVGCGAESPEPASQTRGEVIRVGLLPDESLESQRKRYAGLFAYLEAQTGLQFARLTAANYGELLAMFGDGELDLAYFGGYTFVRALREFDAVPLVMRDTDLNFRSAFIIQRDDPRSTLAEFRGEAFSFGSELSTSGHLMPRYFLEEWDMDPEAFFAEVHYSGAHDQTVRDVANGKVALGVANALIVDEYVAAQPQGGVRILRTTPPYPDYVWAVQADLDQGAVDALRDAFLALSPIDESDARILRSVDAGGYLPASEHDFRRLSTVIAKLEND